MTTPYPQCIDCAHLRRDPETGRSDFTCPAFPDGIPDQVLFNEVPHDRGIDGDRGVRFAPLPGSTGPFARRFRDGVPFHPGLPPGPLRLDPPGGGPQRDLRETRPHTQCVECRHLHDWFSGPDWAKKLPPSGLACTAYPQGIPREIEYNHVPHDRPYPGDGGVAFEPQPDQHGPFAERAREGRSFTDDPPLPAFDPSMPRR